MCFFFFSFIFFFFSSRDMQMTVRIIRIIEAVIQPKNGERANKVGKGRRRKELQGSLWNFTTTLKA